MVPFFSSTMVKNYIVYRPTWFLWLLPLCAAGHALSASLTWWGWRLLFDLPLMLGVFYLSYRWQWRCLRAEGLVATLHIAFLWFALALLLYNIQSAWLLWSNNLILGKMPLHALTLGFMSALLVAMASRVTLGHSGRVPRADTFTLLCFAGINLAALVRLGAEFAPWLNPVSGGLAVLVLGIWAWRYLPLLILPRYDGKPG
jgi:uncharacterized protein involved in response to NO